MSADTVTVDTAGRMVIPAAIRKELAFTPGEDLCLRVENGELRIFSRRQAIKRAQALGRRLSRPGHSLVDELLAERLREAQSEIGI